MKAVNLNADIGETTGDTALLASIQSANIACGFHAGDPTVMQKTVAAALQNGVSIGAHPSFFDPQGFGRRAMQIPADEVYAMVIYQIGALMGVAAAQNARVSHIKPHGALNNMACADAALADIICKAVRDLDRDLIFVAPALSELSLAGKRAGLAVAEEIFADRAYGDDGQLVARGIEGAVIDDPALCQKRVLDMLEKSALVSVSGKVLAAEIHSICVHGDTPNARTTAAAILQSLTDSNIPTLPLTAMDLG